MKAYPVMFLLAILIAGCAGASIQPSPTAGITETVTVSTSTSSLPGMSATQLPIIKKATGKLSSRLEMLSGSLALQAADPEEQARALSLPATGAGSLIRDEQGRLLVTIRMDDTSGTNLEALVKAGATIVNLAQSHQTVTAFLAVNDLQAAADLPVVQSIQEELSPGG